MAIAYDTSVNGSYVTSGNLTFSHTCSGSNRFIVVSVIVGSSQSCSGVTYGGDALTEATSITIGTVKLYFYYKIGPATGANNVVVSASGTTRIVSACSASYTGVKQTSQPDNTGTNGPTFVNANNVYSQSITTSADNSWIVWSTCGASNYTAVSNCTLRQNEVGGGTILWDTNSAQTPAGSKTMSAKDPYTATTWNSIMMSFSPEPPASNIKTINGLAKSSVKTVDGLATASVKTFNGLN